MRNYAKTPTVYQMESTECGAASLSMIFAYFGKHLPLEQIRVETGVSRDGCDAGNIMRAAKKFGLDCHGFKMGFGKLKTVKTPCIIFWNYCHFVVFEGIKGKRAYINDPAVGRRRLSFDELKNGFAEVVLTFAKMPEFKKEKRKDTLLSFAKKRLSNERGTLLKLLFLNLLLILPGIALPLALGAFLDEILLSENTGLLPKLILFLLSAVLLQSGLELYRGKILLRLQKKMVLFSARDFLSRLFRLPMSFFEQRYVGDLTERVSNNAKANSFLAGDFAETVLNLFVAVCYLTLLVICNPLLTLIAIFSVVVNIIIAQISSSAIADASVKLQQDFGELAGVVCAGIGVSSTIKASGAENEYVERILDYNAKTAEQERKITRLQRIGSAIPETLKMLSDIIIIIVGAVFVINGKMTIGTLASFVVLFGAFASPIEKLVGFVDKIQSVRADITRIDDILNYPEDSKFDANSKTEIKTKLDGAVEIQGVSFGYNKYKTSIITDLSFKINCGSSIAIVGTSGSGKSTVSKILSGLYEPWSGKVLFDGVPLKEIPNEVLNASVSTVSQNITLFSGTIRDNLTMWNPKISEQDMIAAAKDACIHDAISQKPGAYDFKLADGGANFSSGQRQQLEIARALVTNPTVLIMDEATSALDPLAEKRIMDNIKRRGCTCVVIAHRLSAIRDCGEIIVLSNGTIAERGTHEKLKKTNGIYSAFIQNA